MIKLVNEFEDIGVFLEFENLRLHCGFTKEILENEQSTFKKQFDKNLENLTGDARDNYLEWQADNHFYLFDVFPSLQWLSLFNTAYSVFEKNMNYICRLAQLKTNSNFKFSDLNGQGIERAKLYLGKVANIYDPFNSELWKIIKQYGDLRNVMAHATGELDLLNEKHKKIFEFSNKNEYIQVVFHKNLESAEIRLGPEIVFESIKNYKDFLNLLSEQNIT